MEEVIEYDDGTAKYNGYVYSRKRNAYVARARDLGRHTKEEWIELCSEYDFRCCYCGSEVIGGIPTKDHIIPITMGGSDSIENLQPLCRQCNSSKKCNTIDFR